MRKAVHRMRGNSTSSVISGGQERLPGITDNAAFNSEALPEPESDGRSRTQKVKEKVKSVAHATKHPKQALKKYATEQLALEERPWLQNQAKADRELLDAHDDLNEAANATVEGKQGSGIEVQQARKHAQQVEGARDEIQAAWHMAHFVKRARVVHRPLAFPSKERYRQYGAKGKYERFKWVKWVGHLVLYACQDAVLQYTDPTNDVPYDREVLVLTIERLLVASGAFQLWWMRVRHVYTWADPWLTAKWLAVFLVLVKTGYVMTFYWSYLLYSVVTNFYGKHSRKWMRESTHRSSETKERASMLTELITRHGPDGWVEPLLDELGPWLQLQLGDSADFLESCANYYDWRNVSSTTATCVVYSVLILVSVIPPLDYSIKVFWLSGGLYFFLSRPIATNYPRFRHIMDPMRWMYWDSPTASETAFAYLQKEVGVTLQRVTDAVPDDESEDDEDEDIFFECVSTPAYTSSSWNAPFSTRNNEIMSFSARWSGQKGRLVISRFTVSFVATLRHANPKDRILGKPVSACWERPFSKLLEVRKSTHVASKLLPNKRTPASLSILWAQMGDSLDVPGLASTEEQPNDDTHCEEEYLYGMDEDTRNEAFNAIIGISGVLWMELQPEAGWQTRMH